MEYFLYAFSEAFRLMKEITHYTNFISKLEDDIVEHRKALVDTEQMLRRDAANLSSNHHSSFAEDVLDMKYHDAKKSKDELHEAIAAAENNINDSRYKIAKRETELLMVFRELMSCEIHAPDHYFDGDILLRQGKGVRKNDVDDQIYQVPLSTFWIPTMQHDSYVDPHSDEAAKFTVQLPTHHQRGPGIGLSKGLRRQAEDEHYNEIADA